ncbi:hypothetical protein C8Q80DRAFT_1262869 [Daedaleopsis nitida]|nr:hypothetical protein C8Q80DRAFT_1262869 [Daedaleopsis nitida]
MDSTETLYDLHAPAWILQHSEIRRRGIEDLPHLLKPCYVWRTQPRLDSAPWAVKIIRPGSGEVEIYEYLRKRNISSPNHTLPGVDIIHGDRPFLIMPAGDATYLARMTWRLCETLDDFYQIVEGIEYLHKHHIAHMDFVSENTIVAREMAVTYHPQLELGKIYIIDFGLSRRFPLGPGQQSAVDLGGMALSARYRIQRLDPYAWDVFCMGETLRQFLAFMYSHTGKPPPRICTWYVQWLIGKERGCSGVCHCRPTARRARQVLAAMRWLVHRWDACVRAFEHITGPGLFTVRRRRA